MGAGTEGKHRIAKMKGFYLLAGRGEYLLREKYRRYMLELMNGIYCIFKLLYKFSGFSVFNI